MAEVLIGFPGWRGGCKARLIPVPLVFTDHDGSAAAKGVPTSPEQLYALQQIPVASVMEKFSAAELGGVRELRKQRLARAASLALGAGVN